MTTQPTQTPSRSNISNSLSRRLCTAWHILRTRGAVDLVLAMAYRFRIPYSSAFTRHLHRSKIDCLARCLELRPVCIYVATGDYSNPLLQRQQHVVRALSRLVPVVYVSPRQGFDRFFGLQSLHENLHLADTLDLPLAALPHATVMLLSVDHRLPKLMELLARHPGRIVYDYIDTLDEAVDRVHITQERRQAHERLLSDPSALVVASARALYDDAARYRSSGVALITNGVDPEHYHAQPSREGLTSTFRAILDQGQPILGYFGALAEWIDYELIIRLAQQRPNMSIVLIGVDYDGSLERHRQLFPSNLHVHPRVAYNILPRYAAHFSASIIPFVLNDITKATSPLKLFEYMALGKPIITTAISEARNYSSPLVAENQSDFIALVDKALKLGHDQNYQLLMASEAKANSWERKAAEIASFCGLIPTDRALSRRDMEI